MKLVGGLVLAGDDDRDGEERERAGHPAGPEAPRAEVDELLRDPVSLAMNYASGVAVLVILGLMVFKP